MRYAEDRPSDSPISVDVSRHRYVPSGGSATVRRAAPPRSWLPLGMYVGGGLCLGVLLVVGVTLGRPQPAAAAGSADAITDNVVRLHAKDISKACWTGHEKAESARLTVALEVGIDGKIRYASASGATPVLRSCVEAHVKSWEFLTQDHAQTMALPFEVDRR